jgi:hypothetical protein
MQILATAHGVELREDGRQRTRMMLLLELFGPGGPLTTTPAG